MAHFLPEKIFALHFFELILSSIIDFASSKVEKGENQIFTSYCSLWKKIWNVPLYTMVGGNKIWVPIFYFESESLEFSNWLS